jgi:hypothetical protein
MDTDRDTFLVAVYTQIDTLLTTDLAIPARTGPTPKMSDSEVLTLAVLGHWRGSSERALLRWARVDLATAFPVLLSQSAFNRRVRCLGPVLTRLLLRLAEWLGGAAAPYEVVDVVPVPLARCCRGGRRKLFGDEAGFGHGGSDHHLFYGVNLLLAVSPDGLITGFVVGSGATQERWLLDALLTWRADPTQAPWTVADLAAHTRRGQGWTGPTGSRWWPDSVGTWHPRIYLSDQGFSGRVWHGHWVTDTGAEVIAGGGDQASFAASQHRRRQIVETVNGLLTDVLHLAFPKAKTMWGVVCRIAAKCAAVNLGIWCNRLFDRPDLALQTLFNG